GCGDQGYVRGGASLQVVPASDVLRPARTSAHELLHVLGYHVGGRLEPAWGLRIGEPADLAELRHEPGLRLAEQGPAHALGVAVQVPIDRESEGVVLLPPVAQLRQRDAKFGRPAERIDAGRDVPHRVPG